MSHNHNKFKEISSKFKLEAAQGVGIPFKERSNENVSPEKNGCIEIIKNDRKSSK